VHAKMARGGGGGVLIDKRGIFLHDLTAFAEFRFSIKISLTLFVRFT
jgi:hypothetical protein